MTVRSTFGRTFHELIASHVVLLADAHQGWRALAADFHSKRTTGLEGAAGEFDLLRIPLGEADDRFIEQPIIAVLSHHPKLFIPTITWTPDGADHQLVFLNCQFDPLIPSKLVKQELGDADALGVANFDDAGSQTRTHL
jgi:hypothetical protein